jgi:hypothetical protein
MTWRIASGRALMRILARSVGLFLAVLAPLWHSVEQVVAWRALVTLGKNSTAIRLQSAFGRTRGGRQFFCGRSTLLAGEATAEAPTAAK